MAKRTLTVTLVIEADTEDLDALELDELPEQVAAALANATGDYEGVTDRTNLTVNKVAVAGKWEQDGSYDYLCAVHEAN